MGTFGYPHINKSRISFNNSRFLLYSFHQPQPGAIQRVLANIDI